MRAQLVIQGEVQLVIQGVVQMVIQLEDQLGVQVGILARVQVEVQVGVQVQVQDRVAQVLAEWACDAFGRCGLQDHVHSCRSCHNADTSAALFAHNKCNNEDATMEWRQ